MGKKNSLLPVHFFLYKNFRTDIQISNLLKKAKAEAKEVYRLKNMAYKDFKQIFASPLLVQLHLKIRKLLTDSAHHNLYSSIYYV